jgi:hypothetical protein
VSGRVDLSATSRGNVIEDRQSERQLSGSSPDSVLSVRSEAVPSAAPIAAPIAIHTGLEVAANSAVPMPAPRATPTPALNREGLLSAIEVILSDGVADTLITTPDLPDRE